MTVAGSSAAGTSQFLARIPERLKPWLVRSAVREDLLEQQLNELERKGYDIVACPVTGTSPAGVYFAILARLRIC